jgi:bifunctional DNA-binding transcriptional regulator/antitoxin component of YhaV-PrlF toxin-antitoxin module
MPQLNKGGKWVFGWVLVGLQGNVTIPLAIRRECGFQEGSDAIFLRGSKRSGGFSLAREIRSIAPLN